MASARRNDSRRKAADDEKAPGIRGYWIRSFLNIALILALAGGGLLYLWNVVEATKHTKRMSEATDALAAQVSRDMARIRGQVDGWRTDPALRTVFRKPANADALRAEETALLRSLPGALSIHLFPPEQTSSVEGIPFMSYAGLDLARTAAQERGLTPIEVHKVGQQDMHLAVAVPVLDEAGERTLGVVHVALPIKLLPLAPNPGEETALVLFQQVVGENVATLGQNAPPRAPDHTAEIAGTRLRAAAWMTDTDAVKLSAWLVAGGLYLVVLGLIAGVLALAYSAQRRDLLLDCKGFTVLIDDALHRRPLRRLRSRLAETQAAHEETLTLLRALTAGRLLPSSPAPLSAPGEAEVPNTALSEDGPSPTSALSASSIEVAEIELPAGLDPYLDPLEDNPLPSSTANPFATLGPALASRRDPLAVVPAEVFRVNDIRGLVQSQLTPDAIQAIGRALGTLAAERGDAEVMIGRDDRPESPALSEALAAGIQAAGRDVVDLGLVPTPLVYFACCHPTAASGGIVTASHNPREYTGVKLVLHGAAAQPEEIQRVHQIIETGEVATGEGRYRTADIAAAYLGRVEQDVTLGRNLKVIVDCGNATTSRIAPALFRALGCEVIELNCDPESGLPERLVDPSQPDCLHDLGALVTARGADLGLAFDGDGDRLGVVDSQGRFIAADRVLMLLAGDVLSRYPGSDVVYDVKCSRHLATEVRRLGGRPVMWRSGHGPIKAKMRDSTALIGGELSGHIVFKERWFGFDDALYAGARLLEVLSVDPRPSSEVFADLPGGLTTPELCLPLPEGEPARLMRAVMQLASRLEGVDVIRIDGLRAEFEHGFGLVRASNTEPKLSFRFEGDDPEALEKIKGLFRRLMDKVARGHPMPF